jgi:hypothetical protein
MIILGRHFQSVKVFSEYRGFSTQAHIWQRGGGGERISCVLVQRFTGFGVAGKRGEGSENADVPYPQSLDAFSLLRYFRLAAIIS